MEILGDKSVEDLITLLSNVTIEGTKQVTRQKAIDVVGTKKHDVDAEKIGGGSLEIIIGTPNNPRPLNDQVFPYVDHQIHMQNGEDNQHTNEITHETFQECKILEDANMVIMEETPQ